MIYFIKKLLMKKNGFAIASLFLFSFKAYAYLPNGKIIDFNFKEQTNVFNYEISGPVGYVSHLNEVFSAEQAVIKIYKHAADLSRLVVLNESHIINCQEITFELNNGYIMCIQANGYTSINLKTDKISKGL